MNTRMDNFHHNYMPMPYKSEIEGAGNAISADLQTSQKFSLGANHGHAGRVPMPQLN